MRISDWSSDVCSSDLIEQHQRRTTRDAVTPLPMAQGCCGKTKTGSKLLLSHPHLGSHCLHIDDARTMHTHATLIALSMRDGLLQALFDTFEHGVHEFRPFQRSTSISTKPASSLRSALVKLTLSPLEKSVNRYSGIQPSWS